MLAVIEHKQQSLASQEAKKHLHTVLTRRLAHTQGSADCLRDQCVSRQRCQFDPPNTIRYRVHQATRTLNCQAGFAATSETAQGHQSRGAQ